MKRMIVYQSKHEGGGNIENICINVSSTGGGRLSRDGRRQEIEIFWAKATQILTPSVEKITYTLSPAEAEFDGLTARSETIQLCL